MLLTVVFVVLGTGTVVFMVTVLTTLATLAMFFALFFGLGGSDADQNN